MFRQTIKNYSIRFMALNSCRKKTPLYKYALIDLMYRQTIYSLFISISNYRCEFQTSFHHNVMTLCVFVNLDIMKYMAGH